MQADLVHRAVLGDRDAFASLAEAAVDRCYAIAFRILRDPQRAQDATQQALIGAWRDMPSLREADRFEAWLYRLVVHACYAEGRRNRRWTGTIGLIPADRSTSPDPASSIVDRDELERGFRRLSPEHRAVIVLHHYAGYPLTEIALTLGVPVGTVRSRLHYATGQLRAAIEADARSLSPEERPA